MCLEQRPRQYAQKPLQHTDTFGRGPMDDLATYTILHCFVYVNTRVCSKTFAHFIIYYSFVYKLPLPLTNDETISSKGKKSLYLHRSNVYYHSPIDTNPKYALPIFTVSNPAVFHIIVFGYCILFWMILFTIPFTLFGQNANDYTQMSIFQFYRFL